MMPPASIGFNCAADEDCWKFDGFLRDILNSIKQNLKRIKLLFVSINIQNALRAVKAAKAA